MAPLSMSSLALAQRTELVRCAPICTMRSVFLCGGHHGQAVCRVVRHGLLAIDILAGGECVHDDLLMPVIGNRDDDGVDIFGVEQFLIAPRGANRFAYDLAGELMATIVEIRGGNALHAGQLDGGREQTTAFHADADNAEADAVAGRCGLGRCERGVGVEKHRRRHQGRPSGAGGCL